MFDTGSFIGGCILGGVFATIVTLALTTAYWLRSKKFVQDIDRFEKERRIKHINKNNGGLIYHDGLDIESWVSN